MGPLLLTGSRSLWRGFLAGFKGEDRVSGPGPPGCHNRAHNGKDFHGRAGRPKNNGYSESSPVTAVTAAEA